MHIYIQSNFISQAFMLLKADKLEGLRLRFRVKIYPVLVCDMTNTHGQYYHLDTLSRHCTAIWPNWLNDSVMLTNVVEGTISFAVTYLLAIAFALINKFVSQRILRI